MATISGCRHFNVNLKAKIYIYVNSTTTTTVVHLEQRISPKIFEKIRNGRNGTLRCLGETDSLKKISWHCPFN
jgi:hypothetical protein